MTEFQLVAGDLVPKTYESGTKHFHRDATRSIQTFQVKKILLFQGIFIQKFQTII